MKKQILLLACASLFALSTSTVMAQSKQEVRQEAKQSKKHDKELTSKIKDNATRDARKETKALEKQGFSAAAGAIPLEKQIDKSWKYQYEVDNEGYPVYFVSTQTAIGGNYNAAKVQANAQAKADLAGQISTEVGQIVKTMVSNESFNEGEAASVSSALASSKEKVLQQLGRTLPVVEISRTLPNKNIEVRVTVAYNYIKGMEFASNLMINELKATQSELAKEVDALL